MLNFSRLLYYKWDVTTHTIFDVLGMDHSNYIQVLMNPNY